MLYWQFLAVGLVSLSACITVAALSAKIPLTACVEARPAGFDAVQTPVYRRLGSIGVLAGHIVATLLFLPGFEPLVALIPLVIVGIAADWGLDVLPSTRLMSVAAAVVLQTLVYGFGTDRAGLELFDLLFVNWLIGGAIALTFAPGIIHAFSLVDGLNGLSAVCAITSSISMAWIAYEADVESVAALLLFFAVSVIGFLPLNFPKAYTSLGTTGANLIGFIMCYAAVMLLVASPDVSPLALLLCVFWPVADAVWLIVRRLMRSVPISIRDRQHMHHLCYQHVSTLLAGTRFSHHASPVATMALVPFISMPPFLATLIWEDTFLSIAGLASFSLSFWLAYQALQRGLVVQEDQIPPERPAE